MIQCLSKAIGRDGMAYGQELDINATPDISAEALEAIHVNKTGKLISTCVELVLIAANTTVIPDESCETARRAGISESAKIPSSSEARPGMTNEHLLQYARCLGLAFQVQDDILDEEGTIDELGKLPGVDTRLAKATYPAIHGMPTAKRILRQLHQQAIDALQSADLKESFLAKLADYIIERKK